MLLNCAMPLSTESARRSFKMDTQNVLETKLSIYIIKLMVTSSLLIACLHKTCCCREVSDLSERAQVEVKCSS